MTKRNKIIYWIDTVWLATGMLSTGIIQLLRMETDGSVAPPGADGITKLGYPVYFLSILGASKILGVLVILLPKLALLKEWAYAGFFFLMSGAIFSHVSLDHSFNQIFPSFLLLALVVVSWYFRPAGRKLAVVIQ